MDKNQNSNRQNNQPNMIFIMTDQQQAGLMSCTGAKYLQTPAIDSLAQTGVRFEKAYCTNPVCMPSRFSMLTGLMPSQVGLRCNANISVPEVVPRQSMGWIFRDAGYDVAYGGKVHLPKGMNPEAMGFDNITRDQRDGLADACVEFINRQRDTPFLLVASFINPHDICYMAIFDYAGQEREGIEAETLRAAMQIPAGVSREEFFQSYCPPVPDNYEVPELEPEAIRMILEQRPFKQNARDTWSDEKWRRHRWAYCRLTERVDAQIGRVLDALREAGLEEDTLIIFSSDHGDMDAAHRMEHKTVLYEEAARVPLIVSFPGESVPGLVDEAHLVSNGLDLIPTLCDYAGIDSPPGLTGKSIKPLVEGKEPGAWRTQLLVESEFGNMIRQRRYKYNLYDCGENRDQLIDLENDPGEMVNLASDQDYQDILKEHRDNLRQLIEQLSIIQEDEQT